MQSMRNRRTISLDLRERILEAYGEGETTRNQVAYRFRVFLGMVKKLLHNGVTVGTSERGITWPDTSH